MRKLTASRYQRILFACLGTAVAVGLAAPSASAQRIGVASAVNPDASGQPPGREFRLIQVGNDMVHNERIVTDTRGRTQLLFLDGSALTIGPNSELVLDEFVYDPVAKTGTLAFSATKGLFRYVGGRISKQNGVSFNTPTALIGIRGGIGTISIVPADQAAAAGGNGLASGQGGAPVQVAQVPLPVTTARLGFGEMSVTTGAGRQLITQPGFEVTIVDPDLPPPPPVLSQSPGADQSGLEGTGDNSGGASETPTNEDVAETQLTELGSGNVPEAVAPPQSGPPPAAPEKTANVAEKQANPTNAQQNQVLDDTLGTTGGDRNTGATSNSTFGGRYLSQTPFSNFDFNTSLTSRVSARNINYTGARLQNGFASLTDGSVTYRLPAKAGSFDFDSSNTNTPFGAVSGQGFGANDLSFFYWNLREVSHSNNPASVFAGVAYSGSFPSSGISAFSLAPGFPGNSSIPALPNAYGGSISGALDHRLFIAWHANKTTFPDDGRSVALFGAIAIDGTGSSQRSTMVTYTGTVFGDSHSNNRLIVSGFSRGSVRNSSTSTPLRVDGGLGATSLDSNGYAFFGETGPDSLVLSSDITNSGIAQVQNAAGFVQSLENPSVEVASFFTEAYAHKTTAPNVGSSRTTRTMNGFVKGIAAAKSGSTITPAFIVENKTRLPSNFTISTNATTNRASASASLVDFAESQSDVTIPFGGLTGSHRARTSFIDDDTFGMRDSFSTSVTVGADTAGTGRIALLSSAFFNTAGAVNNNTTFCSCTHTKWGLISGEVRSSSFSHRQRFHLVPWVAGELGSPTIIAAMTGTASYSGHVFANIMNGTAQYVDTGNYVQSWNFATRTGSVQISNLDGASYNATINAISGSSGSRFQGNLSGAGRDGVVNGAFMKDGTGQAGEVGAAFHVINSSQQYYAAGIGIAKRSN